MKNKAKLKRGVKSSKGAQNTTKDLGRDKSTDQKHNSENINSTGTLKPKRGRLTKTASRRRRARKKALMTALIGFLSIAGAVATFILVFRLESVAVEGNSVYSDAELIEMVPILQDENIFSFSTLDVELQITEEFVYIESVDVRRRLPATVVIEVTPSIERYMIEDGSQRYIVSETLKTLRIAQDGDVFCGIVGLDQTTPEIGDPITSKDENKQSMFLLLLDELEKANLLEKVTEINIIDTLNMEFIYDGRITVVLGSDLSMDYKIQMVNKVLQDSIQESEIGTIDATVPGKAVFKAA